MKPKIPAVHKLQIRLEQLKQIKAISDNEYYVLDKYLKIAKEEIESINC